MSKFWLKLKQFFCLHDCTEVVCKSEERCKGKLVKPFISCIEFCPDSEIICKKCGAVVKPQGRIGYYDR